MGLLPTYAQEVAAPGGSWPPGHDLSYRVTFYFVNTGRWIASFNVRAGAGVTQGEAVRELAEGVLADRGVYHCVACVMFKDGSGGLYDVTIPDRPRVVVKDLEL